MRTNYWPHKDCTMTLSNDGCCLIKLRHEWKIDNFEEKLDPSREGSYLLSEAFKHDSLPDIEWHMTLYPSGYNDDSHGNVSLLLHMSTTSIISEKLQVKTRYSFSFPVDDCSSSSTPGWKRVGEQDFDFIPPRGPKASGWNSILKDKVLASLRKDKSLLIVSEIELIPHFTPKGIDRRRKICKRRIDLYTSGNERDFILECGERKFPVHKSILIKESAIFKWILTSEGSAEAASGRITIENTTADILQQMVHHLYFGSIDGNFADEDIPDLLNLAGKYELNNLKSLCEDRLVERLSLGNVIPMLSLAESCCAEELKSLCLLMIQCNAKEVLEGEDWALLKESNLQLVISTLEKIATIPREVIHSKVKELLYRY